MDVEAHPAGELGPRGQTLYAAKRTRQDVWATVVYVVFALIAAFWGIAAFASRDKNITSYTYSFYANSTTCDIAAYKAAWTVVGPSYSPPPPPFSNVTAGNSSSSDAVANNFVHPFLKAMYVFVPLSAVGGILYSVLYVLLFRRAAHAMVYIGLGSAVVLNAAMGIILILAGALPMGIILLILAILLSLGLCCMRSQLKLCAQLLSISGRALQDNGHLITAAVGIKTVGVIILVYYFAALVSAGMVGSPARSPGIALVTFTGASATGQQIGTCFTATGMPVDCCSFQLKGWAVLYIIFGAGILSWTVQILMQLKLYIVADTVAQWYWMPLGTFTNSGDQPSVRRAVGHALTTGFGSVTFAAAILALLRAIRQSLQRAAGNNVVCCIINCIAQPLLAMCEKFTRFATIAVAITGKPFVRGAMDIFDVLKRNFLATYSLWWVPDMVLHSIAVLSSLLWAGIVFLITFLAMHGDSPGNKLAVSFSAAFVSFGVLLFILGFISGMLLDIVNSAYICFSMDRDAKWCTRPDLNAIYESLPALKNAVIEQPDGHVGYGRAETPAPGPSMQPMPMPPAYAPRADNMSQPLYGGMQSHGYSAPPPGYTYPPQGAPPSGPYPPPNTLYKYQVSHQGGHTLCRQGRHDSGMREVMCTPDISPAVQGLVCRALVLAACSCTPNAASTNGQGQDVVSFVVWKT